MRLSNLRFAVLLFVVFLVACSPALKRGFSGPLGNPQPEETKVVESGKNGSNNTDYTWNTDHGYFLHQVRWSDGTYTGTCMRQGFVLTPKGVHVAMGLEYVREFFSNNNHTYMVTGRGVYEYNSNPGGSFDIIIRGWVDIKLIDNVWAVNNGSSRYFSGLVRFIPGEWNTEGTWENYKFPEGLQSDKRLKWVDEVKQEGGMLYMRHHGGEITSFNLASEQFHLLAGRPEKSD